MASPLRLTLAQARRFARRALWLDEPAATAAEVLSRLGYVQLDPLNVCGRMHDLILRNRVVDYREGGLLRDLHGRGAEGANKPRLGFEHYLPEAGILVAWPASARPFVQSLLPPKRSRAGWDKEEQALADHILEELAEKGPLTSDDIVHEGRAVTAWGTEGRLAKVVLEKLFRSGEVLITERRQFRRVYDLAERVMPPAAERPDRDEVALWRTLLPLRQRRLARLRKQDAERLGDRVQPIEVEGGLRLHCLPEDLPLLERLDEDRARDPLLLAPLDPLIYDRRLTAALWNFDFTWEVYTPAEVRRRGYYSLPVLSGLEFAGDVEPRADWKNRRLRLASRRLRRGVAVAESVRELARFLGVRGPAPRGQAGTGSPNNSSSTERS